MENKINKYFAVEYKLYTIFNGERTLAEETQHDDPFTFISGFGTTIPEFEKHIECLEKNAEFDFTVSKDDAFGDYYEERVIELDKQIFFVNGRFDTSNIYVDAIIPLQNEDGNRFMGHVLAITDDKVRVDLNHPLAGRDLNFVGKVMICREATNEEIQAMINRLSGGCHGGCGGCGGGCNGDCGGDCADGGCGGEGGCGNCGK